LERAKTAREALEVITNLLAQYGQSGNCGFKHLTYYHNSFLLADPHEAWVLETADKHWAAEQVRDLRTISNGITIGNQFDLASPDLVTYAIERGWCKSRDDFHFARCYSDFLFTRFSRCNERHCRTTDLLNAQRGKITIQSMIQALRDHGSTDPNWTPANSLTDFTVCAHPGFGPIRGTGTTGSMVSHLAPEVQTHFVTGTAAPCTSIFKPVWLGHELPDTGPTPNGEYNAATLFWRHEALHRATLRDYATAIASYRDERDELEKCFIADALNCAPTHRANFSARCFAQADQAEARWVERLPRDKKYPGVLYAMAWNQFDDQAGLKRNS
jgi:dipeptidase